MEEDFRLYPGEGVRRLPEKFAVRAADLSRWFKRICAENEKVNNTANAKAAQERAAKDGPAKAVSPAPAPLPEASAPAAVPLPLPGPPVSTSDKWGCSRCKGSPAGCDRCNPDKMAKWADKKRLAEAAEQPAEQTD